MQKRHRTFGAALAAATVGLSMLVGVTPAQADDDKWLPAPIGAYMEDNGTSIRINFHAGSYYPSTWTFHATCEVKGFFGLGSRIFPKISGSSTQTPITVNGAKRLLNYRCFLQTIDGDYKSDIIPVAESAMPALTPAFSTPKRIWGNRYILPIQNFNSDWGWKVATASGERATIDGGGTVHLDVQPGVTETVTVYTTRPGHKEGVASRTFTAETFPAIRPIVQTPFVTDDDGTRVARILYYEHGWTWNATATNGATAEVRGDRLYVSGVSDTATSVVTVTARRFGYHDAKFTVEVQGEKPRIMTPRLRDVYTSRTGETFMATAIVDGINEKVNYDFKVIEGTGTITVDAPGSTTRRILVHGVAPGSCSKVLITSKYANFSNTETPIGFCTPKLNGFLFRTPLIFPGEKQFLIKLADYDPTKWNYVATSTAGTASATPEGILVTNLQPGEKSTVTVEARREGYETRTATFTSQAKEIAPTPILSVVASGWDWVNYRIENFSKDFTYRIMGEGGIIFDDNNGNISFTVRQPGQVINVGVTALPREPAQYSKYSPSAEARISYLPHAERIIPKLRSVYPMDGGVGSYFETISIPWWEDFYRVEFTEEIEGVYADIEHPRGALFEGGIKVWIKGLDKGESVSFRLAIDVPGYETVYSEYATESAR